MQGEGYECKIKINGLTQEEYNLLNQLQTHANNSPGINKFEVGIITFSAVDNIQIVLDLLLENWEKTSLYFYGRDNIEEL